MAAKAKARTHPTEAVPMHTVHRGVRVCVSAYVLLWVLVAQAVSAYSPCLLRPCIIHHSQPLHICHAHWCQVCLCTAAFKCDGAA
jgi:hypothetical protein